MRKISLKKAVMSVAAISITAPIPFITGCNVHYNHQEEDPTQPVLKTITMSLPTDMPTRIAIGNVQTTDSIDVQCFDEQGRPIKAITSFNFKDDQGDIPTWITIGQSDHKFHINANVEVGTYNFVISANGKQNDIQVESEPQHFSIGVYDDRPIVGPDEIEITCNDVNPLVFTTSTADIDLGIIAYRSDYPEELVSKECDWDVVKLIGNKSVDLGGNPLFTVDAKTESAQIKMSTNVDRSYEGLYQLTIKAISVLDPFASDEINININVVDGLYYEDTVNKYYYSRSSIKLDWTLDRVDSSIYTLNKAADYIYNIPVTQVADHFCTNSGITLAGVKLPETYTTIGDEAFAGQVNIYGIEMPGAKYIGKSAFENCKNIAFYKTKPHPQLEIVEDKAFYGCLDLDINSVNSFSQIGEEAFVKTGITNINLGGCIWSIGNNCFNECSKLKSITIKASNPPRLDGVLYTNNIPLENIFVPSGSIENYKESLSWMIYSEKFSPIQ